MKAPALLTLVLLTRRGFALILGAASLFSAPARAAVSILNPSFEDSATWQTSGWLQYYNQAGGGYDVKIINNSHPFFGNTPFGQQYALMEHPDIGNAVLSHVTGFEVGQTYELSFWAAASTSEGFVGISGLLGVQDPLLNLGRSFSYNLPVTASQGHEFADWYRIAITFTAEADTMTVWIGQAGQGFGPVYFPPIAVDQISIQQVPEPEAISLVVCGLFLTSRRRRHA